jgi:GST-like protein
MHTLYGFKGSGSAAIEIALDRTGVQWRRVDAASWDPGSALAELERVNPLKQIPTLVLPGGGVLTESAAILIHLGLEFPAAGLLPADPGPRAQSIRGLVYIAANCYSAIGIIDYPERWIDGADEATRQRLVNGTKARMYRNWEIFADQFGGEPYLAGTAPGALDLLAAVVSKWSGTRPHLRAARPALCDTLERIDRHPGVAAVFARHWDG